MLANPSESGVTTF
ncbi:hypothetical protein LINPERHAP2_LOCUS9196 [Linum perenne]